MSEKDPGKHYRFTYKGIKLDPYRIAKIFGMTSPILFTVLKKILVCGNRGYKDYRQDVQDCINALTRELEMLDEDKKIIGDFGIELDITSKWGM